MTARGLFLLVALLLASCTTTTTQITPSNGQPLVGSVGTVIIVNQSATATAENLMQLQNELVARAQRCATGPVKYDMVVQVQDWRGDISLVTPAMNARVVMLDPASNVVVGTWYIAADRVGDFAARTCRAVFNVEG